MLVHKKTLGILSTIKVLKGKNWVELHNLSLSMFPELNPCEWWEVKDSTVLARKILRLYPDFTPVIIDDALADVIPICTTVTPEKCLTVPKRTRQHRRWSVKTDT